MQWHVHRAEVIVAIIAESKLFGVSVITDLGVEGKIVEVSHEEVQKAQTSTTTNDERLCVN